MFVVTAIFPWSSHPESLANNFFLIGVSTDIIISRTGMLLFWLRVRQTETNKCKCLKYLPAVAGTGQLFLHHGSTGKCQTTWAMLSITKKADLVKTLILTLRLWISEFKCTTCLLSAFLPTIARDFFIVYCEYFYITVHLLTISLIVILVLRGTLQFISPQKGKVRGGTFQP